MLVAFPKHKEIKIGKVDFVVEEVKPKETQKGDFMLSLRLKVKDDEGTERIVYDFLIFNDMYTWKIELFGESLGMGDEFRNSEVETDELIGKTGCCVLTREEDRSDNARFPYRYMVGTYCVPDSNRYEEQGKLHKEYLKQHRQGMGSFCAITVDGKTQVYDLNDNLQMDTFLTKQKGK